MAINLNSPFIELIVSCSKCGQQATITITSQQLLDAARAKGYDMGILNSILKKQGVDLNQGQPLSLRDRLKRAIEK